MARLDKVQEKEESAMIASVSLKNMVKILESSDNVQKGGESIGRQMNNEDIQTLVEQEEIASLWITGDKDPMGYQTRQFNVAKPTADKKEWEKKITDFISYCNKQGLRVTYTPFDQQQENANNPVTLSPDMTPQQIDQAAKDAVKNFEQSHE